MLSYVFSIFLKCKVEILIGVFWALIFYYYFYKRKKTKKEIIKLRKEALNFETYINNIIQYIMSEGDKYTLKEMISKMSDNFEDFQCEVRASLKELVSAFNDYKLSNNSRVSKLEGEQKVTAKTRAIYIGLIGTFIMLVINTYLSIK